MKKEEAIETLGLYSRNKFGIVSEVFWDALDIALKALKSQDSNEIDWNQAPDGANYHTTDRDGQRFFHECEPINDDGYFLTTDGMVWSDSREGSERIVKRPKTRA